MVTPGLVHILLDHEDLAHGAELPLCRLYGLPWVWGRQMVGGSGQATGLICNAWQLLLQSSLSYPTPKGQSDLRGHFQNIHLPHHLVLLNQIPHLRITHYGNNRLLFPHKVPTPRQAFRAICLCVGALPSSPPGSQLPLWASISSSIIIAPTLHSC